MAAAKAGQLTQLVQEQATDLAALEAALKTLTTHLRNLRAAQKKAEKLSTALVSSAPPAKAVAPAADTKKVPAKKAPAARKPATKRTPAKKSPSASEKEETSGDSDSE